jgi:hypothetical protein
MPTNLDGVSVTVKGKTAFVYYISPTQLNILTPPDAISGRDLRKRIRADVGRCGERIGDTIRNTLATARLGERRASGNGEFCRTGCAGRISVQRRGAVRRAERRSRPGSDLRRGCCVARADDHGTRIGGTPTTVTFYVSPTGNDSFTGSVAFHVLPPVLVQF